LHVFVSTTFIRILNAPLTYNTTSLMLSDSPSNVPSIYIKMKAGIVYQGGGDTMAIIRPFILCGFFSFSASTLFAFLSSKTLAITNRTPLPQVGDCGNM